MQSFNEIKVRLGGVLFSIMSLGIFAGAALAGDSYTPAPPIAVPVQSAHERHGDLVAARHPRTRLVDGSGLTLWKDPSCSHAPRIDVWQLDGDRRAVIETPVWLNLPVRTTAWVAVGVVPGMHIHFEAPVAKTTRVREIVQADRSVGFGWYCVYEEFYRKPRDPADGGEAYWSRIEVAPPNPEPNYFVRPGYPVTTTPRIRPVVIDNFGWPTSAPTSTPRFVGSPSFFPMRPANAEIRYRTGVLTDWLVGNKSGYVAITDTAGNTFGYFTGWPMFIDGKQTHCAIPPRRGFRFGAFGCEGGWPTDVIIGVTRVRVYYWHSVTPWGQHGEVTDQIIRVP